jgi:Subtilase family
LQGAPLAPTRLNMNSTAIRRWACVLCTSLGLVVAVSAYAAQSAPKIDPNVVRALDTGLAGASWHGTPRPGRAPVIVELDRVADVSAIAAIAGAGATLTYVQGKPLAYNRFVPVEVTHASLATLVALPFVKRVTFGGPRGLRPLDQSAKLIRLADARGARPKLGYLTGQGVLIADMDSMIDPFAPALFKGDAGYYDWIDVDGDGVFTPGVDAIDLNRNGVADPKETAVLLRAQTVNYQGQAIVGARSSGFDPGIDFLYIDTNGNGKRDYGTAAGFSDKTPAFGEPLFVPDDVNKNGKLDVGERVVRLGTSKIRKIFVYLDYPPYSVNHVYVRGVDLSSTKVDYTGGTLEGLPDALHATGVATILLGDVPLVGRRWVGIAPDAELEVAWDVESNYVSTRDFTWAMQDKPDVALFEESAWNAVPLDGSDALSQMIDTAVTTDRVTVTCPTGDQGAARKHAHADVAAAEETTLPFDLPAEDQSGEGPLIEVDVSVNVRGGTPQAITLHGPTGDDINLAHSGPGSLSTGGAYYATQQVTSRGTAFYDVLLYVSPTVNDEALPVGTWNLDVTGSASAALTVDGYLQDDKSGFGVGAAWDPSVATNASTIGFPSVADDCIAVNASPDHVGSPSTPWYDMDYSEFDVPPGTNETQGQIRAYSPRGPRIDGVMKPDVTAPDNPWVATEHLASLPYPYGSYFVFGGTSGASPHVTATAALLAQAGIRGEAARDAIRSGAIVDKDTGKVPNADYGWGRLDAAGALGVTADGVDPSVTITVKPAKPTVADKTVELIPNAQANDGNNAALEAKWDDGYDGTWDTSYAAIAPHAFALPGVGRYPFKVRVRNASGHVAEAVAWVTVTSASPASDQGASGCGCRTAPADREDGGAGILALGLIACFIERRRRGA